MVPLIHWKIRVSQARIEGDIRDSDGGPRSSVHGFLNCRRI